MRYKLFQIGSFYVRLDTASFKYQDEDMLFGFLSCGGMYKACTDETLTNCKLFKFREFRIGLVLAGLVLGVEKQLTKKEMETWGQI